MWFAFGVPTQWIHSRRIFFTKWQSTRLKRIYLYSVLCAWGCKRDTEQECTSQFTPTTIDGDRRCDDGCLLIRFRIVALSRRLLWRIMLWAFNLKLAPSRSLTCTLSLFIWIYLKDCLLHWSCAVCTYSEHRNISGYTLMPLLANGA